VLDLGQEQSVTVNGQVHVLGRLDVSVIRALREFIAQRIGDPFAIAERLQKMGADKETVMAKIREAETIDRQLKCFSMGCPLAKEYLATEEGACCIVLAMLRLKNPMATDCDAFAVIAELGKSAGLQTALDRAQGSLPNGQAPAASQAASPA
jgi:hypothetical protein